MAATEAAEEHEDTPTEPDGTSNTESTTPTEVDDGTREATELENYVRPQVTAPADGPARPSVREQSWLRKFWGRHVSLTVPHVKCRDHLANERTYLAWLRTSLALSMNGVLISQLFRLGGQPSPSFGTLTYYNAGTPLAASLQAAALVTALIGAHRFWRQQNAMARGEARGAGWEIWAMLLMAAAATTTLFILHVIIYE